MFILTHMLSTIFRLSARFVISFEIVENTFLPLNNVWNPLRGPKKYPSQGLPLAATLKHLKQMVKMVFVLIFNQD